MLMMLEICFTLKISKPFQALDSYVPVGNHPLKMSKSPFISGVSILTLIDRGEISWGRANLAEQLQVAGAFILSIFTFLIFLRVNNDVNNEIIKQAGKRSKRREGEKDVFTEK